MADAKEQALKRLRCLARLNDVLEMEIERWQDAVRVEGECDWSHVGSLGDALGKLTEAVAAVSGMDTDDVEEFLMDGEADFEDAKSKANRNRDRR